MTTLASIFKTKLVSPIFIMTPDNKMQKFICFTDGIQSFLTIKKCNVSISELASKYIEKMLLPAGHLRMIASNTKVISQFLAD